MDSDFWAGARTRRSSGVYFRSWPCGSDARCVHACPACATPLLQACSGFQRVLVRMAAWARPAGAALRTQGLAFCAILLMGCATPDAAGIRGRWEPVNRFAEVPHAIPLQQSYVFQASPADGTLKRMLERWAKDAQLELAYLHPNDYTLHTPVAQIRSYSAEQAAAALSSAYASQGVRVELERGRLVVSQLAAGAVVTRFTADE